MITAMMQLTLVIHRKKPCFLATTTLYFIFDSGTLSGFLHTADNTKFSSNSRLLTVFRSRLLIRAIFPPGAIVVRIELKADNQMKQVDIRVHRFCADIGLVDIKSIYVQE